VCDIGRTYCVIGDPISHSLSPWIHHFVFQSLNLTLDYRSVRVKPENLKSFVIESRNLDRPGWNVTIPHKQAIIPLLDHIDKPAQHIGAVNTVLNENGNLTGFNTDVHGCRIALESAGWNAGNRGVILGAGGAARAAIAVISEMGYKEVILFDIDESKADKLQSEASQHTNMKIEVGSLKNDDLKNHLANAALLINASPVGMWPNADASPVPSMDMLHDQLTILDMVYNPLETKLIRDGKNHGAKTVSGLHMLIGQALAADEIWLKKAMPENLHDQIWNLLKKEMKTHG